MRMFLILLVISFKIVYGDTDVCTTASPLEDVSKRGTGCLGTQLSTMVCDRQLQEGWYYAEHEGEKLTMPTSCPPMLSCGTGGGLWLKGMHPNSINETAEINVCLRGLPTDDDECCAETFPIKVKNCGQFFVYYLTYTTTCDQAYCFGTQSCPVATTTNRLVTVRQTTTSVPIEPSQCLNAKPLENTMVRGTQCLGTKSMICDRQIYPGWYYAEHEGRKLTMPSTCPDMLTCGTGGPVWLKDDHPTTKYSTIDAIACKRGLPTDNNACCAKTYPVKITHCGNFFVYYLSYTDTCDEAYCFGDHKCDKPNQEDDDHEDDDSELDEPGNHKFKDKKTETAVILAVLVIFFVGSVIVVLIIVKRRMKFNRSALYMETQPVKQRPFDHSYKSEGLPLPQVVSDDSHIYDKLTPPPYTPWNINKSEGKY